MVGLCASVLAAAKANAQAMTVYENDFETSAGAEWSSPMIDTTPTGRSFLGRFVNDTHLTLSLGRSSPVWAGGLPPHTSVTASFDLFIIHSWDGGVNGDTWKLQVLDGPLLTNTSFRNPLNHESGQTQNYPGEYPDDSYPAQTGAEEVDALGYWNVSPTRFGDSVYRLEYTFPHDADGLTLEFIADGITGGPLSYGIADESWGLDNIVVSVVPEPATLALLTVGGMAVLRRQRW